MAENLPFLDAGATFVGVEVGSADARSGDADDRDGQSARIERRGPAARLAFTYASRGLPYWLPMVDVTGGQEAPLEVDISRQDGALVVAISGELDISNLDSLEHQLDAILVTAPDRLIFDLGELRFLDSSGIGLLVRTAERAGSVEIHRPSEIVRQVIQYMGLTSVLGMVP